jgi:hypothetical protein
MRTKPTRVLVLGVAFVVSGCGSDADPASTQSGGSAGSGGGSATETGGSSSSGTGGGGANPTGGSGTGGVASGGNTTSGAATGGTTVQPEPFELQGTWTYLGPWDGEHTLQISDTSMVYAALDGEWSSNWTITGYDNGLDHFQLVFESGTGTYYPSGQSISGAYVLSDPILTVQLAEGQGSYPPVQSPGSCTADGSNIVDCRLYLKQM